MLNNIQISNLSYDEINSGGKNLTNSEFDAYKERFIEMKVRWEGEFYGIHEVDDIFKEIKIGISSSASIIASERVLDSRKFPDVVLHVPANEIIEAKENDIIEFEGFISAMMRVESNRCYIVLFPSKIVEIKGAKK